MGAELMLAPGHGLQRHPRELLRRAVDDGIMGDGGLRLLLFAWPRLAHAVSVRPRRLDQRRLDLALRRLRHALAPAPNRSCAPSGSGTPGRASPRPPAAWRRRGRRRCRGRAGARAARRVLAAIAQAFEQPVDVMHGLGAALHRDAGRLVQHHEVVVLVEGDGGEKGALGLGERFRRRRRRSRRGRGRQRRHPNGLAGGKPRARLGPPPSTRTCPVRNNFSSRLCGKSA